MINFHVKFHANEKIRSISSVTLSKFIKIYNNSIWLMTPLSTIVQCHHLTAIENNWLARSIRSKFNTHEQYGSANWKHYIFRFYLRRFQKYYQFAGSNCIMCRLGKLTFSWEMCLNVFCIINQHNYKTYHSKTKHSIFYQTNRINPAKCLFDIFLRSLSFAHYIIFNIENTFIIYMKITTNHSISVIHLKHNKD